VQGLILETNVGYLASVRAGFPLTFFQERALCRYRSAEGDVIPQGR